MKDNNPLNNHVDNLYWGTQAENMSQMRLEINVIIVKFL